MKSVSIPLYKEILLDLQRRIRHGFYGVSGRLPSRRELCGIYGISEMTAYRVQTQLEREGFARREKGRGVFAVQRAAKLNRVQVRQNKVKRKTSLEKGRF